VLAVRPPRRIIPRSYRPAWRQVADDIRDQITEGHLNPGDPLPGEVTLAEEHYDVSVNTIRQAMDLLRREEWIYTERGKGSYVSRPQEPLVVKLPPAGKATVRSATDDECADLDLPPGSLVIEISGEGQRHVVKALGTVIEAAD
jgi:DNA-binding transcriptional regulator YhcF (GntR family)